jgi:putative regulator of septum formation
MDTGPRDNDRTDPASGRGNNQTVAPPVDWPAPRSTPLRSRWLRAMILGGLAYLLVGIPWALVSPTRGSGIGVALIVAIFVTGRAAGVAGWRQWLQAAVLAFFVALVLSEGLALTQQNPVTGAPAVAAPSGGSGVALIESSPIWIDKVPVGSCWNESLDTETGRIFAIVVDCQGPHQLEMIGTEKLPEASGAPFPGDAAMEERGSKLCRPLFENYVGITYDDSVLTFWYYTPDEENWPFGIRDVDCAIGSADHSTKTTGSLRNSRR